MVIGAGMVGIATASWLVRDGHDITVVDPEPPGSGASFGNAGCFNPSSVVPVAAPGMLGKVPGYLADPLGPLRIRWSYLPALTPWLIRLIRAGTPARIEAQARALTPLLGPCLETVMDLARNAGAESLVARNGILIAYRTQQSWDDDQRAWDIRRRNGIRWEQLDADELRQFDPNLSRDFTRGKLVPGNGHCLDPGGFVRALAEALQRDGGRLLPRRATGFVLDGSRLRAVQTPEGEIPADAAVIAAGAHSRPLAAAVGDRVPLETERGYHLMLRDPEVMPRVPTTDADAKFVATPMAGGLRFAGTVELAGLRAAPDWRRARILLRQGAKLFPGLRDAHDEGRISVWMGHRPSLPDSLPVLGPSTRSPDVFHAFGHGHVGMTGGPYTGRIIAALIAGRPAPIELAPYRPDRF
ncbi:MAG TPA: FAD-dependent oxidoreductase [Acetobacteraceae bacterium]|nr:FAD-dependent oxidoreductase [Acetobacteraceae bacterium]